MKFVQKYLYKAIDISICNYSVSWNLSVVQIWYTVQRPNHHTENIPCGDCGSMFSSHAKHILIY